MLNDYGVTKSIYKLLNEDPMLKQDFGITVYTNKPQTSQTPYMIITVDESKMVSWSTKHERIVCDLSIELYSSYQGIKQIQLIATRIHSILEENPIYALVDENEGNIRSSIQITEKKLKEYKGGRKLTITARVMVTSRPEGFDNFAENEN